MMALPIRLPMYIDSMPVSRPARHESDYYYCVCAVVGPVAVLLLMLGVGCCAHG